MKGHLHILKPDGTALFKRLSNPPELEELQSGVEGFIELIPGFDTFHGKDCVAFCNEEGKLQGLPVNELATAAWRNCSEGFDDILVGNVVVITGDRELLDEV